MGVGALTYVLAVGIFIIQYGQPDASGPDGMISTADRVAHYLQHRGLAHTMWFTELLAALLITVGSFTLQHRTYHERGRISGIAAVFLAVTLLFYVESTASVATWLGRAGVVISLVSFSGSVGLLVGVSAFEALATLGLVAFLMTAYLGFAIWRAAVE